MKNETATHTAKVIDLDIVNTLKMIEEIEGILRKGRSVVRVRKMYGFGLPHDGPATKRWAMGSGA